MAEREIYWVVTNCNNNKEAFRIGKQLLKERLVACFDVFSRVKTMYYWPPKSGTIEKGTGAQLVLVTLPRNYKKIQKRIKDLHSDDVPFIGAIEVEEVEPEYFAWLKGELA
jgi:periplasmic divalent cation tolerance protein